MDTKITTIVENKRIVVVLYQAGIPFKELFLIIEFNTSIISHFLVYNVTNFMDKGIPLKLVF